MKRVSHLRSVFIELFARIVSVSFSYHFRIISVSFSYRSPIVSVSFSYHEAEMIRDGRENERMRFGGIIGLTR